MELGLVVQQYSSGPLCAAGYAVIKVYQRRRVNLLVIDRFIGGNTRNEF